MSYIPEYQIICKDEFLSMKTEYYQVSLKNIIVIIWYGMSVTSISNMPLTVKKK